MYLISAYFDDKANQKINLYIKKLAGKTGNTFMKDHNVPPHLTISAVEARSGETLISVMEGLENKLYSGEIQLVSVGMLLPYVMYITPVLNAYLQNMSEIVYHDVSKIKDTNISRFYRPMQWLPHVTIGKKLSKEEMRIAFTIMQNEFVPLDAEVVEIGIAKTNPHEDILRIRLRA